MKPKVYVPYSKARNLMKDGDVLCFMGTRWWSRLISYFTNSLYTHVAMASWSNGSTKSNLECLQFHAATGGAAVNLSSVLRDDPRDIDVYRIALPYNKIEFNPDTLKTKVVKVNPKLKDITNTMRGLTGIPYSTKQLFRMVMFYIPFVRLFMKLPHMMDDDAPIHTNNLVCSTSVSYSFYKNGVDLVMNKSNENTAPGDIGRSPLLNYLFTLEDDTQHGEEVMPSSEVTK